MPPQVLDQSGDTNFQQLYKFDQLYQLPDFVKDAMQKDASAIVSEERLEQANYGDPRYGQFPCHSKAATYVSALFLAENEKHPQLRKSADIIKHRILDKASYHGVRSQVEEAITKVASNVPAGTVEIPDSDFAIVLNTKSGAKERYMPLRNCKEVQAATDYLFKNRDEFLLEDRAVIAENILRKAADFDNALSAEQEAELGKQAGHGYCSSEVAASMCWQRVKVLGSTKNPSDMQVKLAKTAKTILESPKAIHAPGVRMKLACLIDQVDRSIGLHKRYTDVIKRPEDALFEITEKNAAALTQDLVSTTSGSLYKRSELERVSVSDVRDLFGQEFADEVSTGGVFVDSEKLASILSTLPRPDAELFDGLMKDAGVEPVAKQAAFQRIGPSLEELAQLANLRDAS